jgi:hypothetical protein
MQLYEDNQDQTSLIRRHSGALCNPARLFGKSPSRRRTGGAMVILFDDQVAWDGGVLQLRASRGAERSSLEIGERKAEAAELLKPSIVHKIEIGGFDHLPIKTVTIFRYDLLRR